ncbi:MAG: M28 family metallopeptidase [Planctomycetota bacterium]
MALPADLGQRAFAHVEHVVGLGERFPGSPGWAEQIDYIRTALRGYGLEPVVDRWTDRLEGVTFANVRATLPGTTSARLVLGCHHDTKRCSGHPDPEHNFRFVGANDGGSGVGLLLALAEALAKGPQRLASIEFVFFDGEESMEFKWNHARSLFGSKRYVAAERAPGTGRHWTSPIRAMLLLDMVGAEDLQLDDDSNSDRTLATILRNAAYARGHSDLALTEPNTVTDDHLPFLDAGVPAAVLIDLRNNPQWHTPRDTLEHLSPRSLQRVGEIVWTALPEIERCFFAEKH